MPLTLRSRERSRSSPRLCDTGGMGGTGGTGGMRSAGTHGDLLSIGEVAARTGLSVHALRFYEREALLAGPVRRTPGSRSGSTPRPTWTGC